MLTGLSARRYRISASRAPFVTMGFGQRHPNGPAREIDLVATPVADRIDITLPRGGVIAGRVTDDLGEPAAYVRVAAMRPRYSEGRRGLVPTGRIVTTDPAEIGRPRSRMRADERLYVYHQQHCRRCGSELVTIELGGRPISYCPVHQPA